MEESYLYEEPEAFQPNIRMKNLQPKAKAKAKGRPEVAKIKTVSTKSKLLSSVAESEKTVCNNDYFREIVSA